MDAQWLQSLAFTQTGTDLLTVTQGSTSLPQPDPKDPRDFPVGKELERTTYLGKTAKRGSQFSSVLLVYSLSGPECGQGKGQFHPLGSMTTIQVESLDETSGLPLGVGIFI